MSTAMPNVKYGKITGKFYKVLGDGIDPDRYPDGIPEQGLTIEFKTSVKRWKSAVNKAFYYPETIVAFTNSSGVLVDSEGAEGIYLIATDQPGDVLNPREATWTCTIRRDRTVLETFNFLVPSDSEVDLSTVAPVTASGGVQIVSGPRGLPGEKGEKGDPGTASPEDVARALEDEDSAARATLNAAIEDGLISGLGANSPEKGATPAQIALSQRREVTQALSRSWVPDPDKHLPTTEDLISAATPGLAYGSTTTGTVADGEIVLTAQGTQAALSVNRPMAGGHHFGPAQAVYLDLYVSDPAKVTGLSLTIHGDAGLTNPNRWVRTVPAGDAVLDLRPGLNRLRFAAMRPDPTYAKPDIYATWGTAHRAGVVVNGTFSGGDQVKVLRYGVEKQAKAKLMLVNDGAYRSWFDNGYPMWKARGYPLNLAPSLNSNFGKSVGTLHERITWEEWKAYTRENGNSTSFHSATIPGKDGATWDKTGPEMRQMVEIAQQKLRELECTGRIWRAAHTQNNAPSASATFDMLVAAAFSDPTGYSLNGRWGTSPWPPIDPHRLFRDAAENQFGANAISRMEDRFAEMQANHGTMIFFMHALDDEYEYSTSMALWEHFLGLVDDAVEAGWLEVVTFEDLFYGSGGNFEILPDGTAKSHWWTYPSVIMR